MFRGNVGRDTEDPDFPFICVVICAFNEDQTKLITQFLGFSALGYLRFAEIISKNGNFSV